jgi:Domain of Unknown Function (DUF1080)
MPHPPLPRFASGPVRIFPSILGLVFLSATAVLPAADSAKDGPPVALFNGRNLEGWDVFVPDLKPGVKQDLFQVTDGVIHVYPDAAAGSRQPFAYLVTQAEYRDYRLTLEYKWGTKKFAPRAGPDNVRDAGVCYHVRGPNEIWPISVECQIQEGDTGDVWLIHTRGTSTLHFDNLNYFTGPDAVITTRGDDPKGYRRFFRSNCFEQEGWNQVEVTVRGDSATYRVNGHVNNRVTDLKYWDPATSSWLPLVQGRILLQGEGAEILYRHVMLTPLDSLPAGSH